MKKIISITKMSFLALAFTVISCSGSDDGGGGGTAANGTITATVGGSGFTSMTAATSAVSVSTGEGMYHVALLGANAQGKAINLILNNVPATTGTYDIGGNNEITAVGSYVDTNINNPQASVTYVAPTEGNAVMGSISITEITATKIVGTFHFTGTNENDSSDTKAVTNGAFNVNFN